MLNLPNVTMMITLFIVIVLPSTNSIKKCCNESSTIRRTDTDFICDQDTEKRQQIFTDEWNYFNSTKEERCFDVNGRINEYRLLNGTIIEENPFDVNFFPKCCPLNFVYNSRLHSCIEANRHNLDQRFITQNFVQIGLGQCTVVVDYPLNSREDYMLQLNSLHLLKYDKKFLNGNYCLDRDENFSLIARGCFDDYEICKEIRCIRKCCPDGQSFVNGRQCKNTYVHGVDLEFSTRINASSDPFAIIHNYNCRIYLMKENRFKFYLDEDGGFSVFFNKTNSYRRFPVETNSYCIEHVAKNSLNGYHFFGCIIEETIPIRFYITKWTNIISAIFVLLTIIVYLMLPEMMNLFGRILMCYCTSMCVLFVISSYMQFERKPTDNVCVILSFSSIFFSLSGFSWLNVMSYDIWCTFGSPRTIFTVHQRREDYKRFLYYTIYALTLPILLVSIIFLAYKSDNIPYIIRPFIGDYKCYFEKRNGNYALLLYYVTPLFVINLTNLFLFGKTINYCLRVKNEIHRMNDNRMSMKERRRNFAADREQLILILKLSVTMGIFFIFEAFSLLFDFHQYLIMEYIEIVWDTFNSLQGFFIFIIFVCKMKVVNLCRSKIFGTKIRRISLTSTTLMHTGQITMPYDSKSTMSSTV